MGFWSFLGFSDDESSEQENINDQLVRPEVTHDLALDLLRITMLVYNYDKNLTIEENTTIESFVSGIQSGGGIDSLDINDTRKEALSEVAENVPTGKYVNGYLTTKLIYKLVLLYRKGRSVFVLFLEEVNLVLTGITIL